MPVTDFAGSTTSGAASSTGAATTAASSTAATLIDSDFQTFLQLLTEQLKNQDPTNPVDSTDFAEQLATFSGVEQQVQTNALLEQLVASASRSDVADLAGWVGMEVQTTQPVWFDGSTAITLDLAPEAGATSAVLAVQDGAGRTVAELPVPAASGQTVWAGADGTGGTLAPGTYSFALVSHDGDSVIGTAAVPAYATVQEAQIRDGAVTLVLEGGAGIAADSVTALRTPTDG
ncbi:flagellar hook capping FlgD N-terminal domain-containing protein [Frigidibacter oleivorans]|uniref:flagellar hook capping FlgD N-terminal domain-containing protein n=1 Tax=Frigidibacter oleivorans TaxID=2487129 RepID=UPI000F8E172C|nr:flagellar hook capping FlgD N-terminal domain-containing protein [Frigidibacter oleivorans]